MQTKSPKIQISRWSYEDKKPAHIKKYIRDMTLYVRDFPDRVLDFREHADKTGKSAGVFSFQIVMPNTTVVSCIYHSEKTYDNELNDVDSIEFIHEDKVLELEFPCYWFEDFIFPSIYYKFLKIVLDKKTEKSLEPKSKKTSEVASDFFIANGPVYTTQYY